MNFLVLCSCLKLGSNQRSIPLSIAGRWRQDKTNPVEKRRVGAAKNGAKTARRSSALLHAQPEFRPVMFRRQASLRLEQTPERALVAVANLVHDFRSRKVCRLELVFCVLDAGLLHVARESFARGAFETPRKISHAHPRSFGDG